MRQLSNAQTTAPRAVPASVGSIGPVSAGSLSSRSVPTAVPLPDQGNGVHVESEDAVTSALSMNSGVTRREGILNGGISGDPEAVARTLYAELRGSGFSEQQMIALAGELLSLVTADVRSQAGG